MKDYALDKNGDIVLFNNDIEWKTGRRLRHRRFSIGWAPIQASGFWTRTMALTLA